MTRITPATGVLLLGVLAISAIILGSCHSGSDRPDVATAATALRGDMDDDGQPSVSDAIAILRIVVGLDSPDGAADADGDGSTGVNDAIAVLRCVVGLADWPLGEWQLPPTDTLSGVVVVDEFVVGADDRIACTDDVTVQCQTATITGELYGLDADAAGGDGVSVTIEAQGDVTVTGLLAGGDGADGAESDNGANGGAGGGVSVTSANGNVTIGTEVAGSVVSAHGLRAGDGGDGSTGLDGGAGGAGGSVTLEAPNGVVTVHQRQGMFHTGNGGDGGDAVVGGDALLTYTPPDTMPNAGGDGGRAVIGCSSLVGIQTTDLADTAVVAAVLDDGVGSGGAGGDAGDAYVGADPQTGETTWPAVALPVAVKAADTQEWTVAAADGGTSSETGGSGGDAVANMRGGVSAPSYNGRAASARGGQGGSATITPSYIPWTYCASVLSRWHMTGGRGGDAQAYGGDGTDGNPCQSGGDGGDGRAEAGQGGDIMWLWDDKYSHPGEGGDAEAQGGVGARGGDCCTQPAGRGGDGGAGGDAIAVGGEGGTCVGYPPYGPSGDALARGGNGGNGGNGVGPGSGGQGGSAQAEAQRGDPEGSQTVFRGTAGGDGDDCPSTPPYRQYSSLASESMTGVSHLSNWFTQTVDPQQGVSPAIIDDVRAGEGQNLALNADQSQLWVGTGNDIRMYANPLAGSAQAALSLTPDGGAPGGWWPSSIWLDEAHDVLYATDLLGKNIYAWDNASAITANRAADRTLNVAPYSPSGITGGGAADYLFVTATEDGGTVLVFEGASTLDGAVGPARRITGLQVGVAIGYDATRDTLYTTSGSGRIDITASASQTDGAPAATDHRLVTGSATGLQNPLTVLQCFPGSNTLFVGEAGGNLFFFTNASTMEGDVAYAATTDPGTYLMSAVSWVSRTGGG